MLQELEYRDYSKNRYKSIPGAEHKLDTYPERPYCDLCGPFRGKLLRRMPNGEFRCYGCDNEF